MMEDDFPAYRPWPTSPCWVCGKQVTALDGRAYAHQRYRCTECDVLWSTSGV